MSSRISETIPGFTVYIRRTDSKLQEVVTPTNGTRLGLTVPNQTEWHNRRVAFDILITKHDDPLQDTKDINKQVRTFMKAFRMFGQPLLNVMAASPNAISSDEETFNFVIGHADPTHIETGIEQFCNSEWTTIGGAIMKGRCHVEGVGVGLDTAEHATGVELAYTIGDTPFTDPDASGVIHKTYTSATFELHLGLPNSLKKLNYTQRWINFTHPELNGPYSPVQTTGIL